MKFLKLSILILLLFISGLSTSRADQIGNGGDTYSNEFRVLAHELVEELIEDPVAEIDTALLAQVVESTKVSSQDSLLLDGKAVDAINYPHLTPAKIVVSRAGWDRLRLDEYQRTLLVLHEYLWVVGVDDTNFQVSSKIDRASVCGRNPSIRLALEEYFHISCHRIRAADLKKVRQLEPSWLNKGPGDTAEQFKAQPLRRSDLKYFDQLTSLRVAVSEFDRDTFKDAVNISELGLYFSNGSKVIPERSLTPLTKLKHLWVERYGKHIGVAPKVYIESDALPANGSLEDIRSINIRWENSSPTITFSPMAFSSPVSLNYLWIVVSSDYSAADLLKGIKSIDWMKLKFESSKSLDQTLLTELKRVEMQQFEISTQDSAGIPFGYIDNEIYNKYYCENIDNELKCAKPW